MAGRPESELDILHVDMDAFFAAVEVLDDPCLEGRAVLVGGTGVRGVVASCSYEARRSGVRSAMPMSEARRRCPDAVVLPGRHGRYSEVSAQLRRIFEHFTPVVEPIALDEAFLDVAGSHQLFGSSVDIAWAVRSRVLEDLGLACSVGVARTKLVAKLASKAAKPRASAVGLEQGAAVVVVEAGDELAYLQPRPVSDLWGVGPRTADRLASYGLTTVGDLAKVDGSLLERLVGSAVGRQLHELAWGHDNRRVESERPLKSVGHEETFPVDLHDAEEVAREVRRLSESVASRSRKAGVAGRTVTAKVRFGDFTTVTRSQSLRRPIGSSFELARIAGALVAGVETSRGVRLLGVSLSTLEPLTGRAPEQLAFSGLQLDRGRALEGAQETGSEVPPAPSSEPGVEDARHGEPRWRWEESLDEALDAIRARFGVASVGAAVGIGRSGIGVKQVGDGAWGPDRPSASREPHENGETGSQRARTGRETD